jgi:phosphohistidine swiveling domain-containing protein
MTTTSRMVSFSLRGDYLTEQAREKMGDGEWKEALALLVETLVGMTYDQAIGILEGTHKMSGEGTTLFMEEETREARAVLQEHYKAAYGLGGHVKFEGWMYEPYRIVDNLGEEDAKMVLGMPEYQDVNCWGRGTQSLREEWLYETDLVHMKSCYPLVYPARALELRGMFYADSRETELARMLVNSEGKHVIVLFRRASDTNVPFWRAKDSTDMQVAFSQLEPYLSVTGYSQYAGELHPSLRPRDMETSVAELTAEEKADLRARQEVEMAEQVARELKHQQEAIALSIRVREFANKDAEFGWYDYQWKDPETGKLLKLRAPKRALYCYALSRTNAAYRMPAYEAISPDSFKTGDDDRYHTDVWLGCGLALDRETYVSSSPEYRAVLDMMFQVQRELLNFEVQVLARGPEVTGTVVYADSETIDKTCVLVVPHAGVEFELQAMKAGAVITEAGGKLAHLVTVCREMDKPIIRMDGARDKLRPGQSVTVNPAEGKVEIYAGTRR